MNTRNLYQLLFLMLCLIVPSICLAQGPPDPNDVPLDGGLSLLIIAGTAYGIRQYRKKANN